ncbi:MAG: MBL fold metallo-hydrolase [Pseudomonadota bacterium]
MATWRKEIALGGVGLSVALVAGVFAFQKQIGAAIFERAVASRVASGGGLATVEDGLHVGLCGTGSPMPAVDRAGPCNLVIAGDQTFVIDAGEGAGEVLNRMGFNAATLNSILLTHFHSDHIDGIGPLTLVFWTRGTSAEPLPVYGPKGVETVVDGLNQFYALDREHRIAHHGGEIVPISGGGAVARPFEMDGDRRVVLERDDLTITAFRVDHDPVEPALGYRFDYKGRSLCISGDTAKSTNLEVACEGVDVLVHDALQPAMLKQVQDAWARAGQDHIAQIMFDIQDYHASPEEAAESAQTVGARMLVLSHLVPPLQSAYFYPAFLRDASERFDGTIVVGEDGMFFSMPSGGNSITKTSLF